MVEITIFVEGVNSINSSVLTADSSMFFRENFHKLFSQQLHPTEFDLKIISFGSVTQTKSKLSHIESRGLNGVILIDLDAQKEEKNDRLNDNYSEFNTDIIFFMIQEMEAWILSQTDKIEIFGKNENLIRKRDGIISDNQLIKNKHPETIKKPSKKLDTILRQCFDVLKVKGSKKRVTGKRYLKSKDAPKLIGLLDLSELMKTFDEVDRLVNHIKSL
ncbi:DUF4276 family protein [Desulfocicer vacuolatum]|nr:DUF4276 family protein [Desulfocicer vacuolatum]